MPELIALLLENRGISTNSDAKIFLGGKEASAGDPFLLPDFEAAVSLLRNSIRDGRLISVYGDFDVDGITSTAILSETITDLGGKALPYIPQREREGYGLNLRAIESLADRGVEVLVTCDCGTTSLREITHARELGLEVIVIDHHSVPDVMPPTAALVNPKLPESRFAFSDHASGGLAYLLAGALYDAMGRNFPDDRYLELATLATVADMVPLHGENRQLVRRGLDAIARTNRPGLLALIEVAGLKPKAVTAETIAFGLAPRINAAGRLADARLALDLLMTREEGTALGLAQQIDGLNRERQRMTQEAHLLAGGLSDGSGDVSLTLVGHEDFHQGIIGLVASRLVENHGRPAVVYQRGATESRASCRSIPDYDIVSGLRACADLFERFGGHRQAGGFTILNDRLPELEQRLLEHAAAGLDGYDLTPSLEIDAEWPLANLRTQEFRWLNSLQPHGQGNPGPRLLSRDVRVVEARGVGEEGRHLKLKLKAGPVVWPAIAFNWDGAIPAEGSLADAVYGFSADRFGPGEQGGALQLIVEDLALQG